MAGILWADSPYGLLTFVLLTLVLGGARRLGGGPRDGPDVAADADDRALHALSHRRRPFLHYALYGETLLSLHFFIVAYVWTIIVAAFGYRQMRAAQMATQYSWAYQRVGLNWRTKTQG